LLEKTSKPSKCLIIAAGSGSRLASKYDSKPLAVTGYHGEEVRNFLNTLAVDRKFEITHIINDEWKLGNGYSVLKAKDFLNKGSFFLMMADHIGDAKIITRLKDSFVAEDEVNLAIDTHISNPLVDLNDVTRVRFNCGKLLDIGKTIKDYNAFDTGFFYCTPALFGALEKSIEQRNDSSLSGGIRILAEKGKMSTCDINGQVWIDVDDAQTMAWAEKALLSNLGKPNDGPVSRFINRPISARISRHLVNYSITPNQISFCCFLMSVVGALFFALEGYFALVVGAFFAQVGSIVDGCDGEVARLKFQESDYGRWFDAVLDRYADAFLLFGLTWHSFAVNQSHSVLFFGFLAIIGTFMNSYTADKYDRLMAARIDRGLSLRIGRDVRVFLICVGALLNLPFLTLIIIAVLMNVETIRRIIICRT